MHLGPNEILRKRGGKGNSKSGPQGRHKTRLYYSGRRMGPPNKKHAGPASNPGKGKG